MTNCRDTARRLVTRTSRKLEGAHRLRSTHVVEVAAASASTAPTLADHVYHTHEAPRPRSPAAPATSSSAVRDPGINGSYLVVSAARGAADHHHAVSPKLVAMSQLFVIVRQVIIGRLSKPVRAEHAVHRLFDKFVGGGGGRGGYL